QEVFEAHRSEPQPRLERAFGHRHQEPAPEDEEGGDGDPEAEHDDGEPAMAAHPPHVEGDVERGSHVEAGDFHDRHHRGGRHQHRQHRAEPFARDEDLVGPLAERLQNDQPTGDQHRDREPERKEAALGTVAAPVVAETDRVEQDEAAQRHQHGGGREVGGPHRYFLSSPPFAISSRWSFSLSSTHFTYSSPVAKAGFRAPSSMYFFHSGVSVTFLRSATYQSTA